MKGLLAAIFAVMIGLSFVGSTFAQATTPAPSTGDKKEQMKEKKAKKHKKKEIKEEKKEEKKEKKM